MDHAIARKAYEEFVAAPSRPRSSAFGLSEVRRVVVILSSSRGGSSLLFYLLRATGQFLSLEGEHTPFYKLYGFGLPTRSDASDADVDLASGDLPGLCQAVVDCFSQPLTRGVTDPQRYSGLLAMHMVWQWPELEWNLEALADETNQLAHAVSQLDASSDTASHFLAFLGRLRSHGIAVDPWYYDLPASMVMAAFPGLKRPAAPPFSVQSIEEPPFVVPQPTSSPSAGQLASVPVLLKASIDAYRPRLLRAMFPNAVIKVIHLVRNPGATINGLYDGWLDRGFYSHNLVNRAILRIRGYSHLPWGRSWWNFDLPPGWSAVTHLPLQDICALQWCSAHEHILSLLDSGVEWPGIRIRAEDLIRGGKARSAALARICTYLGIAVPDAASWRAPLIMSTRSVGIGRWRARADLLASVLRSPRVTQLSARLGYHSGRVEEWV